ncbi:hypothetical protein SAMN05428945_5263 [Streptomyces sp. 2224.1]|nr:hypothetical protein SAMN05428945_5263 [Streptomyces sp. 2224.1]
MSAQPASAVPAVLGIATAVAGYGAGRDRRLRAPSR